MTVYNFSFVGDIEDDPLGIWEKTAVGAGSIRGDGTYADVSSSAAAAWFFDHLNSQNANHWVKLTWGSGAIRNQNGLVINCLDANDHIWAGCQTFGVWKVREYLAGAITDIAVLSVASPAENETHKLERVNSSTVLFDINGSTTTSIASTLYNTIKRRGLKVNNNTNANIWKTFEASDDFGLAEPGAGKVRTKGNVADARFELISFGFVGSVRTRGNVATIGGVIFETVDLNPGRVKTTGNQQTVEAIGGVEGINNGVGRVATRGNQATVDFKYTADLTPGVGNQIFYGNENEITGRLFIDAVTGSVRFVGSSGGNAGLISVVDVITGKMRVQGSSGFVISEDWIPDQTVSNTWTRLIGDGDS